MHYFASNRANARLTAHNAEAERRQRGTGQSTLLATCFTPMSSDASFSSRFASSPHKLSNQKSRRRPRERAAVSLLRSAIVTNAEHSARRRPLSPASPHAHHGDFARVDIKLICLCFDDWRRSIQSFRDLVMPPRQGKPSAAMSIACPCNWCSVFGEHNRLVHAR